MAEKQVFEEINDQLECIVCWKPYTTYPKILPCHHSFCLTCIEKLSKEPEDGKYYISCPKCRADHQLPQGGAKNLPNDSSMCLEHKHLLDIYCESCDQAICQECAFSNKEHNEHIHNITCISECYPKHRQQILNNLIPVTHKLADINTAMTHLAFREGEVLQQGENIKEKINQRAQQLIEDIQRSRTHLTQQVDTMVQQKTQTLATQRQQAQQQYTQLQTCQDTIEQNLKKRTQQQILTQKHTMMDEMNTAAQHVDPTVFLPIENADIEFNIDENSLAIGIITSKTYCKPTLKVSQCLAKQPSTATLTLQSQDGSPFSLPPSLISSTLSSPVSEHSVKCPITQTQPGKYIIEFTPLTRLHQLVIQVKGVVHRFTLPMMATLEMRGEPVTIPGLIQPKGVAVSKNGDIVVAESGIHQIAILRGGEKIQSFRELKLKRPRGVAISNDGHILVTDNHRLLKLTPHGVCVKTVGTNKSGCDKQQFNTPDGIAVHSTTGQIFVADSGNNRIQVFSDDLTFLHAITPPRLFRRFNNPCDVALDSEGYLYVAESHSNCVTKLSFDNESVITFNNFNLSILCEPCSLTIHHDLVYVSEWEKNYVLVFDTNGRFIKYFGKGHTPNCPWGTSITVDALGNLYVSESFSGKIAVY